MVSRFWKFAAWYLVIGIFWAAFTVSKGAEVTRYNPQEPFVGTPATVIINALGWPASISFVLYHTFAK